LDASDPLNIHLSSSIKVDVDIARIVRAECGLFCAISEEGILGIIDHTGHFTPQYTLGEKYGELMQRIYMSVDGNLVMICSFGVVLRLFRVKNDGTAEVLSKIYYTYFKEEGTDDDKTLFTMRCSKLKWGFSSSPITVLGGKYLLHASRHIILTDIQNPKEPKLSGMITIPLKNNTWVVKNSYCFYSENEILITTEPNCAGYYMMYLVEVSPEGITLKQSFKMPIKDNCSRELIRKDNYLITFGSNAEVFEIN
jgi:hypothetical protein